jgi:hypothetical protein
MMYATVILTNYRRDPPPDLANIKFTERADQLLKGVATEKEQRNNTVRYTVKKVKQVLIRYLFI